MSFRYRVGDVRGANLASAAQFDANLEEQFSGLQNVDRDQVPHDTITAAMINPGAIHQLLADKPNVENAVPNRRIAKPSTVTTPAFYCAPGLYFQTYSGGDLSLLSSTIIGTGGIIQAEFSCWVWRESQWDYASAPGDNKDYPYSYYLKLLVNGEVVASSGHVSHCFANIHLVGTAIAPEGATVVTVEWGVLAMDDRILGQQEWPQAAVGGTSLLIQNRRA